MKQQPVALPVTRNAKLMHLYSIIEDVPPEQVSITHWACGTVACVAGWACLDPTFNKMGLELSDSKIRAPVSGCGVCDYALRTFFGLSIIETSFLFHDYINKNGPEAKEEALLKIKELMG